MRDSGVDEGYPGVGRLNFFLGKVSIGVAMVVAITLLGAGSSLLWWIGLVLSFVSFGLDVMRLRNIGVTQWLTVLRFVPYVNLLYMIFLQSAQAGWEETRRLDRQGRTLAIFQFALVLLMFLMLWRGGMAVPDGLF